MPRANKLDGLPLKTLFSQVLEFEGKARANPIGRPFLGKLLVLPANVKLDWKVIARYKHSSLFGLVISDKEKEVWKHWHQENGANLQTLRDMLHRLDSDVNNNSEKIAIETEWREKGDDELNNKIDQVTVAGSFFVPEK